MTELTAVFINISYEIFLGFYYLLNMPHHTNIFQFHIYFACKVSKKSLQLQHRNTQ